MFGPTAWRVFITPTPDIDCTTSFTLLRLPWASLILMAAPLPGPHGCGDLGAAAHRFLEFLLEDFALIISL
jgi:hypothetical protein